MEMLERIATNPEHAIALVDGPSGTTVTFGALVRNVHGLAGRLGPSRGQELAFLLSTNTLDYVLLYLACLEARIPALLVDPGAPMEFLLATYRPSIILAPDGPAFEGFREAWRAEEAPSYRVWQRPAPCPVHPDLALLLSTSGSTGSPKLVRLTRSNLVANATSIATYLELDPGERAIQSLPMFYSYGLSVLNSHLVSGGSVVLTPESFLRPAFWQTFDSQECTSFAGIPYMYETLHRLRFDPAAHPSLRTLTQAGGGLKPELISHFHDQCRTCGKRLVVMYGQTEATARISYVPPGRLGEKIGSIGIAIPGGSLNLRPIPGMEPSCEMIYRGPNVMMGYAESRADLALGDVLHGELATRDLAVQDEDGYFRLVGRLSRFAKLFGRRISLEEVERNLEREFQAPAAVVEGENRICVFMEGPDGGTGDRIAGHLAQFLGVPPKAIDARIVPSLPRTGNGKKNYSALLP
jgi:long-chain acyl-CoA synthetase